MKTSKCLRIFALVIACTLMLQVTPSAAEYVSPRSNAYITRTFAMIERGEDGFLNIFFDITGKGKMDELGATTVYLYEVDGMTERLIATFNYLTPKYADMMGGNSSYHSGNLPYNGTPGHKYYATVYFRAGNSSGSGTTSYTTSTVVAW